MYKSGFVTLLGRPNVGKSSLMNQIIGEHLSIISSTAQTTRNSIKGIYTTESAQIIFIDTPGLHKPKNELGSFMNKQSYNSLKESDAVLWIVDATCEFGPGDEFVLKIINELSDYVPVHIVFNKMDLITEDFKQKFEESKERFITNYNFKSINYISATSGENVDLLLQSLIDSLDEGPQYYEDGVITDSIERFIASELIREKIFLLTKDEIPHSIAVDVDDMKTENNTSHIYATIYVDRDSQKKIIIGSKGELIKKIGSLARKDIEMMLGNKVYLELWVKVDKDWRNNKQSLSRLGYK